MQKPAHWHLYLAFAAVYLSWGTTYLGIRFAVETLPPLLMSGVRFIVSGGLMIAVIRARGAAWPTRRQGRSAAIVGLFLLFGGNGGVTWAEQFVPSGLTALLIASVPLWVVLMDWLRPGGLRPAPQVFAGVALGLLGLFLLVGPGQLSGPAAIHTVGAGVVLLAAFLWATGTVYGSKAQMPAAPLMGTGLQMLSGGLALALGGLLLGEAGSFQPATVSTRSLLAMLYLIVVGSFVGFTAYSWLLRNAPPAQTATYAYVNPVVAVFLGWLLAEETLTPRMLLGAVTIVAAVAIITTFRGRRLTRRRSLKATSEAGD